MFEGGLYGRVVEAVLVEVESRSGVKADVDEPGPEVDVDAIEAAPELEVDTDADGEAPEVDAAEAEAANVDKAEEADADTAGAVVMIVLIINHHKLLIQKSDSNWKCHMCRLIGNWFFWYVKKF